MGTWTINSKGGLQLTPENDTESFALEMWKKYVCQEPEVFINMEILEAYKNTPANIPTLGDISSITVEDKSDLDAGTYPAGTYPND